MSSSWTLWPGLSGTYLRLYERLRKIILLQGVFCLALCVSACGDSTSGHSGPSPPAATASAANSTSATPPLTPLIAPPGSDERPPAPGSLGRPLAADGLPSLQPARGVNVNIETLFSEDIKDPIERSKRVETAVIEMRRDLDATMPAIKRLVAIESDIQLLTSQLQTLLNGETAPPPGNMTMSSVTETAIETTPPEPAALPADIAPLPPPDKPPGPAATAPPPAAVMESPVAEPVQRPVATSPPAMIAPPATPPPRPPPPEPKIAAGLQGIDLRLGEHADKTRIVIDLNGAVTYRHDLDNDEKILVIELDKAGWSGPAAGTMVSPLVQSWSTQPMEQGGTRIIVLLKQGTAILKDGLLNPDADNPYYRLMLDLRK